MTADVEDWKKPGYIDPDNAPLAEAAAAGNLPRH